MNIKEHFLHLKKLFSEWQTAPDEQLKTYKITTISQHIRNNDSVISVLVKEYDSGLTQEILDEIKFKPGYFKSSMHEVLKALRKEAIIRELPEELNSLKKHRNSESQILKLIDTYGLRIDDKNISSSSHDTDEFIHNCNSIILRLKDSKPKLKNTMDQGEFTRIFENEIRPFAYDLIHKKQLATDKIAYVKKAWQQLEEKLLSYDLPDDTFKDLNVRYRNLIQEKYK